MDAAVPERHMQGASGPHAMEAKFRPSGGAASRLRDFGPEQKSRMLLIAGRGRMVMPRGTRGNSAGRNESWRFPGRGAPSPTSSCAQRNGVGLASGGEDDGDAFTNRLADRDSGLRCEGKPFPLCGARKMTLASYLQTVALDVSSPIANVPAACSIDPEFTAICPVGRVRCGILALP